MGDLKCRREQKHQRRAGRGDALLGATANLSNSPPDQYSEHICSCQSDAGGGGRDAVATFFVSLRQQWCCGGDTLGRTTQLERRLLAKAVSFYNPIIYNYLKENKDDLVVWRTSWHVFRFCSRRGLSRASNQQQYLKHGSKQNGRLLLPLLLCRISTGYKTDG